MTPQNDTAFITTEILERWLKLELDTKLAALGSLRAKLGVVEARMVCAATVEAARAALADAEKALSHFCVHLGLSR